jgi:hypothetical protein
MIPFLQRLIVISLGATVATVAAATFVIVAHRNAALTAFDAHPQAQLEYFVALLFGGPVLALLLSIWVFYTFVPALIGVLISETFAIRSWIFHAANGGLSAWLGWAQTQDFRIGYSFRAEPRILVAAGLAAGLVYWIVAGRTAGFWRLSRSPQLLPPAR